jgi:hypothetical protein
LATVFAGAFAAAFTAFDLATGLAGVFLTGVIAPAFKPKATNSAKLISGRVITLANSTIFNILKIE